MREYARVVPKFWTGETGKALRQDREAQVLALYLMTCPSSNMLGLYYLPIPIICHETGLSKHGALKGLRSLSEAGFCSYDTPSEHVFVVEMAAYQIGPRLSASDNKAKGVKRELEKYRSCCFFNAFLDRYAAAYHLEDVERAETPSTEAPPKPPESPSEAPSKPLPSPSHSSPNPSEAPSKQLTGAGTGAGTGTGAGAGAGTGAGENLSVAFGTRPGAAGPDPPEKIPDLSETISQVFTCWRDTLGHSRAQLDAKRRKTITSALQLGYTPAELCEAIRGCALTPHNMGENDRGTKYDALGLILRDADQIDRFIRNAKDPPQPRSKQGTVEEQNRQAGERWAARKRQEASHDPEGL